MEGDFNMVQELKDRVVENVCNTHLAGNDNLNNLTKTQKLYDTWRKINREKIEFTYHRPLTGIHSRLDRIYASNNLLTTKSEILPFHHSDHEALLTEFTVRARTCGLGYWKLNTSILEHETFKTATKNFWLDWLKKKVLTKI